MGDDSHTPLTQTTTFYVLGFIVSVSICVFAILFMTINVIPNYGVYKQFDQWRNTSCFVVSGEVQVGLKKEYRAIFRVLIQKNESLVYGALDRFNNQWTSNSVQAQDDLSKYMNGAYPTCFVPPDNELKKYEDLKSTYDSPTISILLGYTDEQRKHVKKTYILLNLLMSFLIIVAIAIATIFIIIKIRSKIETYKEINT
eukprot:TRINITY_DN10810_c0_g1_i1.p1 TRINITY_DN10810_c0_g1~~TRINITY_DN10810_c0_g1_i1.p1  ORF type:complete len:199 (-),score=16.49 TRINITY_DN10810_c0_g1_i1:33-629(-)